MAQNLEQALEQGLELVRRYEGWSEKPYCCPAGKWTIGYGHCCAKDHPVISREQGEAYVRADFAKAVDSVLECAPHIRDGPGYRIAALACFVFNVGITNFSTSTLLQKVRAQDWQGAAQEFARWNKATVNGKKIVLPGLTKRRHAEAELFMGHKTNAIPPCASKTAKEVPWG